MNNVTIVIPGDAVAGSPADDAMDRLRDVHGLSPDMLTVDFSAIRTADTAWLAMLHLVLLDIEDRGALVLLDHIPAALTPMLEATGMNTAFFCRHANGRSP
ncbi:MAG TPA: hypothetical protein VGT98_15740 [Candidatus Elarobacter sp.]|nr:hypothetical protein [Candidatus Elarobacter sp.]